MSTKKNSQEKSAKNESPAISWFIVKEASEQCKIVSEESLYQQEEKLPEEYSPIEQSSKLSSQGEESNQLSTEKPSSKSAMGEAKNSLQQWGPFETQNQAIAKRIGLIRAGKCQPN